MSETTVPVSETTERTPAPRPMFTGTLHLPSRSAPPKPESPAPAVRTPAPLPGAVRRRPPVAPRDRDPQALGELIGVKRVGILLKWWISCPAYVAAVAAGGHWHSLDGSDAGEITEKQRSIAGQLRDARAHWQPGEAGQ